MRTIEHATEADKAEILALYKIQLGREFCPWSEHYPTENEIDFDLSRDSLIVMREDGKIIASISIDEDEAVNKLPYWTDALKPGGEVSRLAVLPEYQNQGIAREMIRATMEILKERGFKSIHFLVNRLNTKAMKSYAKLGFDKVGELEIFEQPMICYEKKL
ncbi:MAG: GNAT family N-acetyltransferase [Lachnospiraceae bacterium]|nr:GNAT family N-acetyltransferase [Lachnospiraceae bacterium]